MRGGAENRSNFLSHQLIGRSDCQGRLRDQRGIRCLEKAKDRNIYSLSNPGNKRRHSSKRDIEVAGLHRRKHGRARGELDEGWFEARLLEQLFLLSIEEFEEGGRLPPDPNCVRFGIGRTHQSARSTTHNETCKK